MATECSCKHGAHTEPVETEDHAPGTEFEALFQMNTVAGHFNVCEWCKNHHFTHMPSAPDTQRLI
jgi:hypothetical protein